MKTLSNYINERFISSNNLSQNVLHSIMKHFEIDNLVKEEYLDEADKKEIEEKFKQCIEKNNLSIQSLKFYINEEVDFIDKSLEKDFTIDSSKISNLIWTEDFVIQKDEIFKKGFVRFYICDKTKKFMFRTGPNPNTIRAAYFETDF